MSKIDAADFTIISKKELEELKAKAELAEQNGIDPSLMKERHNQKTTAKKFLKISEPTIIKWRRSGKLDGCYDNIPGTTKYWYNWGALKRALNQTNK